MQQGTTEHSLIFRPYTPDTDLPHLARLLAGIEAVDQDGEDTSENALRAQLAWPNYHPSEDCCVVSASGSPDALIGYSTVFAQTSERCILSLAVHPTWRRKGIGGALLAWALERAKARGAHTVAIYANARNATANAFIRRLGFLPTGSSWVLYAPSDLTLDEPLWPDGYSARSYAEVGQLATLTDIFYRGYHDLYGHSENTRVPTEQEMANWLSSADPEAVFLALAPSGDAAGICTVYLADTPDDYQGEQSAEQEQARDLIDAPGVAQEYRGMGIHRPLLLTALHWQRAHGERPLTLESWGDSEETIAIYRSIGFSLMQRYIAYHHDLILSDWH